MKQLSSALLTLAAALLSAAPGRAQMHKVARPEQVVRAVGVYEWTGDLNKPTASRLVPVSLFINGSLEDAGVYLPRPIPFALTPGNEYELEQAGLPKGALDLAYATHLQTADSAYEDGWFGYGSYKAPPAPKKEPALHAAKTNPVLTSSKDDTRPHFAGKGDAQDKSEGSQKSTDPTTPAEDPDRPTMRRRSDPSPTGDSSPTAGTGSTPADDPDRPTLRRRSPEDEKKSKKANDVATVTGTGTSLNDDPDRPKLQRGAHSSAHDTDMAKLVGVPKDLKQMVAVSDAANRPPHDFARPWQDDKERAAVLARMQALARAELLTYNSGPGAPAPAPTPAAAPAPRRPSAAGSTHRSTTGSAARRPAKPAHIPETPLLDEDLKAYTLSYGGAPTYIYTAHTGGTGPDLRYVTVIAQADMNGELRPAVKNVTDEAHLDRTPRMRLVDVVDAQASNRASLLLELRAQNSRQFALYQVIGSRAEPLFTTGTTQ